MRDKTARGLQKGEDEAEDGGLEKSGQIRPNPALEKNSQFGDGWFACLRDRVWHWSSMGYASGGRAGAGRAIRPNPTKSGLRKIVCLKRCCQSVATLLPVLLGSSLFSVEWND
jgi:hypothetical protein